MNNLQHLCSNRVGSSSGEGCVVCVCVCVCVLCVRTFALTPMLCDMSPRPLRAILGQETLFLNNLPPLIWSGLDLFWDVFEAPTRWGLYRHGYQTKKD